MNTLFTTAMAVLLSLIPTTATVNADENASAQAEVRQNYNIVRDTSYYEQDDSRANMNRTQTNTNDSTSIRNDKARKDSSYKTNKLSQNRDVGNEENSLIAGLPNRIRVDVYMYFEDDYSNAYNDYGFERRDRNYKRRVEDNNSNYVDNANTSRDVPRTLEMRERDYALPNFPSRKNTQAWNNSDAYHNYKIYNRPAVR